jgi:hypothetical protein
MDSVDGFLQNAAKDLHRRVLQEEFLPLRELFLIGVSRKGLVEALKSTVWDEALADPLLNGDAAPPPDFLEQYPSVTVAHLSSHGVTLPQVKKLMKRCTTSRAQRYVLQTLGGHLFRGVVDGKFTKQPHVDFLREVTDSCGKGWWKSLPQTANEVMHERAATYQEEDHVDGDE